MLEIGCDGTKELQEVVLDEAHNMEAVGHDASLGEVSADECSVGAAHVDADDPNALSPL